MPLTTLSLCVTHDLWLSQHVTLSFKSGRLHNFLRTFPCICWSVACKWSMSFLTVTFVLNTQRPVETCIQVFPSRNCKSCMKGSHCFWCILQYKGLASTLVNLITWMQMFVNSIRIYFGHFVSLKIQCRIKQEIKKMWGQTKIKSQEMRKK